MSAQKPRVVIVGAGFGGLRAARALAGAPVEVVLIDRNNYHLFQPLLYQVAVAALPPSEIAYPVRSIVRRQRNLEFRVASVEGFDLARRVVATSRGEVRYDRLIVAAGAVSNDFGVPGVADHGFELKTLSDALRIRNHVIRCFEEAVAASNPEDRRALLTIVVAGGGPTGVEVAGAMSELLRRVLARDYPRIAPRDVTILLLEGGTRVLASMPHDLSLAAASSLERLGVELRFAATVTGYDGAIVSVAGAAAIATRTLVWAAGVRATPLLATLGVPLHRSGRVIVEPTLQVPGHPEIYAIGDAAYLDTPGGPVPMLAPPAMQMGACAARNVLLGAGGRSERVFRYRDPGTMATIGRSAAVAVLGGHKFRGLLAWFIWLVVHLLQLIGFRNKLVVFVDWAWQYLFYRPASPLIVEDPPATAGPAPD
jgi:NADH:ubiquinone reductase (H+-translocating)